MSGLWCLMWKSLRSTAHLGRIVRQQSYLKMAVIFFFALFLLGGLGALFYGGFSFLASLGGAGLIIVHRLFSLFFFGLGAMLVFSSAVTAYSTIHRSEEMAFLFQQPILPGHLSIYKFLETSVLSSWAFFFMIVPFLGAYAAQERLSPWFALWTTLYAVPFVLLCSALGTFITIVAVRWLPRGRWLGVLLTVIFVPLLWQLGVFLLSKPPGDGPQLVLNRLIPGMKMSSFPLWPSFWVAEGIMAMARDHLQRGLQMWLVLTANVGGAVLLVEWAGRAWMREGWQRGQGGGLARKRSRSVDLRGWERWFQQLPADARALLFKDVRVFLRDPVQWSQGLVFFGLLAIYFMNLRNLRYHLLSDEWRSLIVFLNILSVSAVMCSMSARFVYPQMSLEGQSFWIIGMSPMSMRRILRTKFIAAACLLVSVSMVLAWISSSMLAVGGTLRLVAMAVSGAVSVAVAGLSVGLGAVFMDLRNRNPVAIISGFGGTLNLVMGLIFMMAAILPFGALFHFDAGGRLPGEWRSLGLAVGFGYLSILTALAVVIPLWLGRRSLALREY